MSKKILDFKRVGSSVNSKNMKTVGKVVLGGIIGEALPSVFQRITGKQSHGVAGNAISGVVSTVMLLAMNQKEMAAGVVATKAIKATIVYGNPVIHNIAGVPLALPATNDGYTQMATPGSINPNASLEDDMPGVEMLTLPNGQQIATKPRELEQSNPVVNYDKPNGVSDYLTAADIAALSDNGQPVNRFTDGSEAMLNDNMPGVFDDGYSTDGF